jgi:hypothetical protein
VPFGGPFVNEGPDDSVSALARLALIPMLTLAAVETALYNSVGFFAEVGGDIAAVSVLGLALIAFNVLTAVHVARSVPVQRLRYGVTVATLVWGMQLPVLLALTWIVAGPPVLADDSLWNVSVFGWWYTAVVSIPLIGLLCACAGWILEKRTARAR